MMLDATSQLGPLPIFLQGEAAEIAPIIAPAGTRAWLVRDYALGRKVLTDPRFSRAEAVKSQVRKFSDAEPAADSMMSMDGAEHTRLRRTVAGAFSTHRIATMTPQIERMADGHLERMAASGPPADLIAGLAAPLPLAVLCSLLGVPVEDHEKFRDWVEVLFDISGSSPAEKRRRRLELVGYMADLVESKHFQQDDDLISYLIGVHDQGGLSRGEMLTLGLTLLMAGYETTVGQISLTVLSLLSDPQARQSLREQPGLLPAMVEEFLRLSPSTPVSFPRVTLEPVELGGVSLGAGETIVVSLLHGNRDQKVFAEPAQARPGVHDQAHLTFGHGLHRCLGAPLARLQVQIAVNRLLRRFPDLRVAPDSGAVIWKDGLVIRGLSRLLLAW